jgi:hypothetical protein
MLLPMLIFGGLLLPKVFQIIVMQHINGDLKNLGLLRVVIFAYY